MGYQPIARTAVQYVDVNGDPYSGAVLKAYSAGTSDNISIATDAAGGTTAASVLLNANGYPEVSGSVIIPHLNEAYKLSLYSSQAAADSDTGAIWTLDNQTVSLSFGERVVTIDSNTTLTQAEHANAHLVITGSPTITLPPIASVANAMIFTYRISSGTAIWDGDGSEEVNGATTVESDEGSSGMFLAGDTSWEATGTNDAQKPSMPAGSLLAFAGSSAPAGYLFCYGQAVSRTTYATLYTAIGTAYGTGDGSTTFNLPDLRGRVAAGKDDMGGSSADRLTDQSGGLDGDTLGGTGGSETHTLTTAESASHSHEIEYSTNNFADPPDTGGIAQLYDHNGTRTDVSSESVGGDGAHNNVQPTIILNYIIRT